MESTANGYNEGSPPRVRGKGRCARQVDRRPGITPACAGKSLNPRTTMPLRRDHPRVCGEKASACVAGLRRGGSPPRVRGKAGRPVLGQNAPGITPACAGKRRVCHRFLHPARDHPRVCGEKQKGAWAEGAVMGSPPRVRGKGSAMRTTRAGTRITPACAGKRLISQPDTGHRQDHPRVCGEKQRNYHTTPDWVGSPPRVRGKAAGPPVHKGHHGITPACAGKSWRPVLGLKCSRDHPRVCGEKLQSRPC